MARNAKLVAFMRQLMQANVQPMARARKHLVCVSRTPYYHVMSRCVRRAFLCGVDRYSGKSYEHRRAWIEDRLRVLSSLFSIDLCAYAIMSNHYHLVVRLNPAETQDWSDDEVLNRWTSLFRGPLLVQRRREGEPLSAVELDTLRAIANVYRRRLGCLSWFMKCLNEPIARKANVEDRCTGHFWEARFQSQPLCSEQALLTAMAYVDLNPVRAKIARTPEQSEYTSIRARISGHYCHSTLAESVSPAYLDRHILARNAKLVAFMRQLMQANVQPMARARKHLVCVSRTPYYHVMSRCVRRAFLCGVDRYSGKSYEHRRAWIEDRLRVLSSLFSIDLCAYAIMSNHYHLVVRLNPAETQDWSDDEVLNRWTSLFRGPLLVQRRREGEPLSAVELDTLRAIANVYRRRLGCLSWFMKCLNEPIARKANVEDRCTGHFWEARFQSQPLCSEQALLTAMAYVDLNPVRAKIARTPEQSEYTSIRARISEHCCQSTLAESVSRMLKRRELQHFEVPVRPLMPFADALPIDTGHGQQRQTLPMDELDYLKLVDASGRIAVHGKRGRIDPGLQPVLERLALTVDQWIEASTAFQKHYRNGGVRLKQPA